MSEKKEKFVIIDGNAIVHRAWHALPPTLMTKNGQMVNAVYGFTSILLRVYKDLKPDYLVATFDLKGPTFRHKEYKEYKATREKKPDELYEQIPIIKEVVRAFGIPIFEKEGYEADDVIATIATKLKAISYKLKAVIVTGDMDTLQLVDDATEVYSMHKGISDILIYDTQQVKVRYDGLAPEQVVDFKALRGDPSDNIPGVKGIGEKTAIELLREFTTLENIYKNLDSKKIKPRYQKLLSEQKEGAFLSKKLVTLVKNVPISLDKEGCKAQALNIKTIVPLFQRLEFKSLLARVLSLSEGEQKHAEISGSGASKEKTPLEKPIGKPHAVEEGSVSYHLIDTEKKFTVFLQKLKQQKEFAFDTETNSVIALAKNGLVGTGFAWKTTEAYFVPKNKTWYEKLKPIFENPKIKKIGQNIKFDIEALFSSGIRVEGVLFDTMIASYLINPGSRQHSLDSMAFTEFGYQMQPIEDLIGKKGKNQKTMAEVPLERVSNYCCEDVDFTLRLVQPLKKQLAESNNVGLFEKIEMPVVYTLFEMEKNGVKIDSDFLATMSKSLGSKIKALEEKIYTVSGKTFNIASPIQLKEILFDVLNISTDGLHKTKTGISSAAAELEKLKDKHPVISLIMEYRELAKLLSTYVDALPKLVSKQDGRVHTSFNQTIAATGRLSSSNPNLQNIPIRTQLGQEIRKAFIADKGNVLIAADYSQIELRVIASLANDKAMIEGFKNNEDIHIRTASEIAGVEQSKVTPQMRRAAKAINFGIIYGMGSYGLATREGISNKEAKQFIEKYFALHGTIKEYLEKTKELAREKGYVETLFGRRRYFPEIHSSVHPIRAAAERMATNHPIQGTAADLIKLAMIEIYKKLPAISKNTKMILQVHDELIFEAPQGDVEKVALCIKDAMEKVYELRAPIVAKVEAGKNWGEMKPLINI